MSGSPWFKCDPVAFNDGMIGLTMAQRGAYATVLNCIYIQGGPVRDNPGYFSALLGCEPKDWASARKVLVGRGKLVVVTLDERPHLFNLRAGQEIAEYREWIEKSRRGGLASARARGHRPPLKIVEQKDDQ